MPTLGAVMAVMAVGVPAALLAAWFGWRGVRAVWPVLANLAWPTLATALYLAATNSAAEAYRMDAPLLSGALLGGTLAALSAPLWLGGLWIGRRARQVRAG